MTRILKAITEQVCLRCEHKWLPRQKEIHVCPSCKSPYWDRPKTTKKEAVPHIHASDGNCDCHYTKKED